MRIKTPEDRLQRVKPYFNMHVGGACHIGNTWVDGGAYMSYGVGAYCGTKKSVAMRLGFIVQVFMPSAENDEERHGITILSAESFIGLKFGISFCMETQ